MITFIRPDLIAHLQKLETESAAKASEGSSDYYMSLTSYQAEVKQAQKDFKEYTNKSLAFIKRIKASTDKDTLNKLKLKQE